MNNQEIINRGYVLNSEYEEMKSGKLEKLMLTDSEGFKEGVWIYPLTGSDKQGADFYFVFFNNPLNGIGSPRPVAGLVGIAKSRGDTTRGIALYEDCVELFKKAGKPAIDYYWDNYEKETFDSKSLGVLYGLNEAWMMPSYGATLARSISILLTLYKLREQGYTELIVRNPKTGQEKMVVWP